MSGELGEIRTEAPKSVTEGLIKPGGPELTGPELKAKEDSIFRAISGPGREVKPEITTPDLVGLMRKGLLEAKEKREPDTFGAISRNIGVKTGRPK